MPKQKPSTRASGNVNLSFGLVNIPVTLYTGTVSAHGITKNEFGVITKDDGTTEEHPLGRGVIDKVTGELLEPGTEVVKKIQTEYGPVFVEDSEIETLFEITPDSMVVTGFEPLPLFQAGQFVPKSLMFVEPRKTGTGAKKGYDAVATKSLLTLLKAMREKNAYAKVELTTRGVPKPGILGPDGRLWLVWHTDALREQRDMPEPSGQHPVADQDVKMMGMLMDMMWSNDPLDMDDNRSALIQAFADEKAAAGDFSKPEETVAPVAAPSAAPDLMALLAASIDSAKKESA